MKEWHRASLAIAGSLDPVLAELIEIRSSQVNGCANCISMHSTYASTSRTGGSPRSMSCVTPTSCGICT